MTDSNQDWHITACNLCNVNCGLKIQLGGTGNQEFTKIKGDPEHPSSDGYICNKAARLNFYQNNPNRLQQPMRRKPDGSYEAVSWETATSDIANKLNQIKQAHGGERIIYYGGGGQGNHLGGVYGASLRNALGVRYKASALSQEKTGLAWVFSRMVGDIFSQDFENSDVVMFMGKNPFMSHGIEKAREFLRKIKKDPDRKLIVVDPRRSETADYADIHLAVTPGRDAWLMAAIVGFLVQKNRLPLNWLQQHTNGFEVVKKYFEDIPVDQFAEFAGVEPLLLKETANIIADAKAFTLEEDLGVQMAPHSTLVTYLNFLSFLLTGNYGKKGTTLLVAQFINIITPDIKPVNEQGYETERRCLPVTGARIISGLFPGNYMAEEILNDHPERPRALIIESSNPVHSLADSKHLREAIHSLEFSLAIDIAMTETAMECDYVLPADTQYEKWEGTFFPRHFPNNIFHLRAPVVKKQQTAENQTLPEPEIHTRIIDALNVVKPNELRFLRLAAIGGLAIFQLAFFLQLALKPKWAGISPYILYKTLGPALPEGEQTTAAVWGIAQIYARKHKKPLARAGIKGFFAGNKLYRRIMSSQHGAIIGVSEYQDSFDKIPHKDGKIQLVIAELLDELKKLNDLKPLIELNDQYPFALIAGSRTAYTANCVIRDPKWTKGKNVAALSIHPQDALKYQLQEGDEVLLETRTGSTSTVVTLDERMHCGTLSVPNGQGMHFTNDEGDKIVTGVFANELTASGHRDKFIGTPLHKFVPARISNHAV